MKRETFDRIKKEYSQSEAHRRTIIENGNAALRLAKQAIFALHRNNVDEAKKHLEAAETTFTNSEEIISDFPKLNYQGAHRAALEEYVEAKLFLDYVEQGKFGPIPKRARRPDAYLAGLSDFTGELVRLATRKATNGSMRSWIGQRRRFPTSCNFCSSWICVAMSERRRIRQSGICVNWKTCVMK